MTNTKTTKRAFLSSVVALILCFAMLLGTTFAWFTDSAVSGSNVITAGNLDVVVEYTLDGENWKELDGANDLFKKGLWEPGHTEVVALKITNNGSLALKYNANMNIVSETKGKTKDNKDIVLSDILTVDSIIMDTGVMGDVLLGVAFSDESTLQYENTAYFKDANVLGADQMLLAGTSNYLIVKVDMAESVGNDANHNGTNVPEINFGINVLATQYTKESDSFGNQYDKEAEYPVISTPWDGTVDTSWFFADPTATSFEIENAQQLAGFAALVNGTATIPADVSDEISLPVTFDGVTVKLIEDVDLAATDANGNPITFTPIGNKTVFSGTFDGNGHTISNLYQSGWALGYEWGSYGSIGLFGEVESATIKNLTIEGAYAVVEGGDVAGITGSATGDCVFENITIKNSGFGTYNNGLGGIIGWSGAGNYTFKNVTIAEDVVLGGLWGSFDSSIGGVVGQGEPGATYNFENVDVACRIDAYNDCTASYDYYNYRMCGMIIGRLAKTTTIDGVNYPDTTQYNITCEDVTVTYGDWANYHYCDPTPGYNSGRGMRVESGFEYDGLPADYDHSQCTTHHMELIPFDQIFGGDQYAVKGLTSYDGVEVIYNNK